MGFLHILYTMSNISNKYSRTNIKRNWICKYFIKHRHNHRADTEREEPILYFICTIMYENVYHKRRLSDNNNQACWPIVYQTHVRLVFFVCFKSTILFLRVPQNGEWLNIIMLCFKWIKIKWFLSNMTEFKIYVTFYYVKMLRFFYGLLNYQRAEMESMKPKLFSAFCV